MKKFLLASIVAGVLTFSGCSTVGSVVGYAKENQATAYVTVQYATAKVIKGEEDRALAVLKHVSNARAFVSDSASVTVSNIVEKVKDEINFNEMKPEDRALISLVLVQAQKDLEARIGEGVLNADQVVTVNTLLDWIEQGAVSYVGQQ